MTTNRQYEETENKHYSYTIITTDSNKQLRFLHDRMPVILDNGSEDLRMWLDPKRHAWSKELQALLKPFDGELEVYPVSKDVGKVGNNSPTFLIPIDSKENRSNIANFFAKGTAKKEEQQQQQPDVEVKKEEGFGVDSSSAREEEEEKETKAEAGVKREADDELTGEGLKKKKVAATTTKSKSKEKEMSPKKGGRNKISATSNGTKSPSKAKQQPGTQKITRFFGNSS